MLTVVAIRKRFYMRKGNTRGECYDVLFSNDYVDKLHLAGSPFSLVTVTEKVLTNACGGDLSNVENMVGKSYFVNRGEFGYVISLNEVKNKPAGVSVGADSASSDYPY